MQLSNYSKTNLNVCQHIPFCFSGADEELGAVGVRSSIGHGQDTCNAAMTALLVLTFVFSIK